MLAFELKPDGRERRTCHFSARFPDRQSGESAFPSAQTTTRKPDAPAPSTHRPHETTTLPLSSSSSAWISIPTPRSGRSSLHSRRIAERLPHHRSNGNPPPTDLGYHSAGNRSRDHRSSRNGESHPPPHHGRAHPRSGGDFLFQPQRKPDLRTYRMPVELQRQRLPAHLLRNQP